MDTKELLRQQAITLSKETKFTKDQVIKLQKAYFKIGITDEDLIELVDINIKYANEH